MTAIEALEELEEYIKNKRDAVYSEMGYANEHKFKMEWQALQYKSEVYNDINGKILVMLHKLYNKEE